MKIRLIKTEDLKYVKSLADNNREALGFNTQQKFKEVIEQGRGFVALENKKVVGFVIYRHRKIDTQTTLSEICVAQDYRGHSIGTKLVKTLIQDALQKSRSCIQLKCPVNLPANEFYRKLGFKLIAIENGKRRQLNVWQLLISSANEG